MNSYRNNENVARQEGIQQGLQEGHVKAYQTMLVDIVRRKFPSLRGFGATREQHKREHIAVFCEVIWLVSRCKG